jgi:hypothetical protein
MSIEPSRYQYARAKFMAGELLIEQAILMLLSDHKFEKEAASVWGNSRIGAEKIVRDIWVRELIECMIGHELPEQLPAWARGGDAA